ncbi:MAG: UDP-N-acetylmuramoyl-L-alanyl-D-glutamate--2,6-diaminopimelate ligase [Nitrospinae bacterium]|nr:UDP-N-acetylmuramoyl-L-alanyl-D-glutamate--2,6-diaminopimelate ligase [Nitrospinota bacterium]
MVTLNSLLKGVDIIEINHEVDEEITEITGIAYDSRKAGDRSLFIAIKGFNVDGHDYIDEAIKKGAVAIVSERPIKDIIPKTKKIIGITVSDSRRALAIISNNFYEHPSREMRIVGITGTNGKTTTSYLIRSIFESSGFKVGVIGTIWYTFGDRRLSAPQTTPESLDLQRLFREMVDIKTDYCILEVSSHSLELNRVFGSDFDIGLFTNLGHDHLDFHETIEGYFRSKMRLFSDYNLKRGVVNIDDQWGKEIVKRVSIDGDSTQRNREIITFGINGGDIRGEDIEISRDGIHFVASTPIGKTSIESRLIGYHNVYNILASVAVAISQGITLKQIREGVTLMEGVPGRFECLDEGQNFLVVVDYAHTDDALRNVIISARGLTDKRIITIFGCGGNRDKTKRPLMGKVAITHSDITIITSDNPRGEDPQKIVEDIERGIKGVSWEGEYNVILDRHEAIEYGINKARPGDIVIIAGKGHETYQIIGNTMVHFDDREVAREVLRGKVLS